MDYIDKIIKLLDDKNISRLEFASKINKSFSTVNNYLTRRNKIDIDTFIQISKVLEVQINYFFENEENLSNRISINEFIEMVGVEAKLVSQIDILYMDAELSNKEYETYDALFKNKEVTEILRNKTPILKSMILYKNEIRRYYDYFDELLRIRAPKISWQKITLAEYNEILEIAKQQSIEQNKGIE